MSRTLALRNNGTVFDHHTLPVPPASPIRADGKYCNPTLARVCSPQPRHPGRDFQRNFQRLSLAQRVSANGITVIGREHESVPAKPKVFSAERKVPDGLEKHAFRRHVRDNVSAVLCRFLRLHGPGAHDDRHEDQHKRRPAGLDTHRQHHPDVEHRQEADLVDHSLPDSTGQQ